MVRVIVADDHHLVRQGIRMLLETAEDIEVIGEAQDGLEAVELAEKLAPDILVMDISMPRLNGAQATELVRSRVPSTQVVVLSHARRRGYSTPSPSPGRQGIRVEAGRQRGAIAGGALGQQGRDLPQPAHRQFHTGRIPDPLRHLGGVDRLRTIDTQGAPSVAASGRGAHQQLHRLRVGRHGEDRGKAPGQPDVQAPTSTTSPALSATPSSRDWSP